MSYIVFRCFDSSAFKQKVIEQMNTNSVRERTNIHANIADRIHRQTHTKRI